MLTHSQFLAIKFGQRKSRMHFAFFCYTSGHILFIVCPQKDGHILSEYVVCPLIFPINIVGVARCFTYGGSKNSALHDRSGKACLDTILYHTSPVLVGAQQLHVQAEKKGKRPDHPWTNDPTGRAPQAVADVHGARVFFLVDRET